MDVATVLNAAADLIEPEGRWTQGTLARDEAGLEVHNPDDAEAYCWCVAGAIQRVTGGGWSDADFAIYHASRRAVLGAVGLGEDDSIAPWNDAPERTQAEVITALRQAALSHRPKEATDD